MASRSVREPVGDGPHLGPHRPHVEDIQLLAANVLLTHVDHAVEAEAGTGGRSRHAVLAGSGLCDDALLPHPQGQQSLPDRVVDLVGTGVVQVFSFEIDLRPAAMLGEPLCEIERAGSPDERRQISIEFPLKLRVFAGGFVLARSVLRGRASAFRGRNAAQTHQTSPIRQGQTSMPLSWESTGNASKVESWTSIVVVGRQHNSAGVINLWLDAQP